MLDRLGPQSGRLLQRLARGVQVMTRNFVLTMTGADRIGIVEDLTRRLLEHGGNVETSRMARLGGEFAVLMLVSMPEDRFATLDDDLRELASQGCKLTTAPTELSLAESRPGWLPFRIEVEGADNEGIIHRVARQLSFRGISIESMETETATGPFGAVPLFNMSARVAVPPDLDDPGWADSLSAIGDEMNLEIRVIADPDS